MFQLNIFYKLSISFSPKQFEKKEKRREKRKEKKTRIGSDRCIQMVVY